MKCLISAISLPHIELKILLFAALLCCASMLNAQIVSVAPCIQSGNAQTGLPCSQVGTVGLQELEKSFLTISGRRYGFDYELSKVFLGDEEVGAAFLDTGMVVRFTADSRSTLLRIEILGPFEQIRLLLLKES